MSFFSKPSVPKKELFLAYCKQKSLEEFQCTFVSFGVKQYLPRILCLRFMLLSVGCLIGSVFWALFEEHICRHLLPMLLVPHTHTSTLAIRIGHQFCNEKNTKATTSFIFSFLGTTANRKLVFESGCLSRNNGSYICFRTSFWAGGRGRGQEGRSMIRP